MSGDERPEPDARATRSVAWRAAHSQSGTRSSNVAHGTTPQRRARGEQDVGRPRMAGQRGAAGRESRKQFANWARGAIISGHGGAVQQCGPHRRKQKDKRKTRNERYVAWCAARSKAARATPRDTAGEQYAGRQRTAKQQSIPDGTSQKRFAN